MREILFRGKTEKGEWIYGSYINSVVRAGAFGYIAGNNIVKPIRVIRNTVGQFTGLTDKNGKKIFEGDIVRVDKDGDIFEIMYCERGYFCANNDAWWEFIDELGKIEVIGNIHDNPELLEVQE